jgi:hypothetical protein
MSRLLTMDNAFTQEYPGVSGGTFTATNARTGNCYRVSSLVSGTAQRARAQFAAAASNGPYFFRLYVRFATLPLSEDRFTYVSNSATIDAGVVVYLTIDALGNVRLYDEDGQIGSASSALSTGTYYRIEYEVNRGGSAGAHVVRARIDGTEFAGANNRDLSVGINMLYMGGNLHLETITVGDWSFDDVAINDGLGSYEYSYPGDGAYMLLRPNAAGDNNAWTNDYTTVDDTSPNDATDFQASNTLNAIIDHNLTDMPAGIGNTDTIKLVTVNSRHNGAAASANSTFVLRAKMSSSGVVEESAAIQPTSTTWRTNDVGNTTLKPPLTLYDMPGPINTFITKTDLDLAQIGARISVANTNNAQISMLWMGVEWSSVARSTPLSTDDILQALL